MIDANQILATDIVLALDRVQLCLQYVVLLRQLDDTLLQHHIVEATLLARSFRRLIVASPPIPVAVVLLVVRDEFPLLAL